MSKKLIYTTALVGLGMVTAAGTASAAGRLVIYCSNTNAMCEAAANEFGKKYDVRVSFSRDGTGSTLAKISAEKDNPKGDVWYGGTMDPHSQAGEMGLLEAYKSPVLPEITEKFRDPAKVKGNFSDAIYIGVLGFGINENRLKEKGIAEPKCWKDLTDPAFKDEIQIADPQSSGTAYTALATFIQIWNEDEAFEYLRGLNQNISQYTKSGITPSRNAARGETTIGIGFLHDYVAEKEKGAPLKLVVPCEGTGYEIGGLSIIKGARNLENAKLFVDYALSVEGQENAWKKGESFQTLTNTKAANSPFALKLEELKLINYDMETYGSSDLRKRLITKWLETVKMDPAKFEK
ncbi:MAG: ABC transporter substrate-binding protein [Methylobacteriaceae bacterium]|jgi:iron(III) transport system substrate-binding protein|nr:ABC transporter substrate-binding protein [Methylobacteriaceae bacterium]